MAKLNKARNVAARFFVVLLAVVTSAWLWVVVFAVGGAAALAVGVAIEFGAGFGLMAAGVIGMFYGAATLRGMRNGG